MELNEEVTSGVQDTLSSEQKLPPSFFSLELIHTQLSKDGEVVGIDRLFLLISTIARKGFLACIGLLRIQLKLYF